MRLVKMLTELSLTDVPQVGGKNASLGEMAQQLVPLGVRVAEGFATTADAYREYLDYNGLTEKIAETIDGLDEEDVAELSKVGSAIREIIFAGSIPPELEADVRAAYAQMAESLPNEQAASWAVRSSATAEDLPEASFAGQQETFLNVRGEDGVLEALRGVFASLYNDRAIAYRVHHGFAHGEVAISAGVQRMIRSDVASSGVMFTVDTESGFDGAVFITSAYGLGEAVVQGAVSPDEFYVFKPTLREGHRSILRRSLGEKAVKMMYTEDAALGKSIDFFDVDPAQRGQFSLTDDEVLELAQHAVTIEDHYGRAMDIEWAKDGVDGLLYILQARPETVTSQRQGRIQETFHLSEKGPLLVEGRAIGQKIGQGRATVLESIDQMVNFTEGNVLVADMTDPDWEPIMKRAAAIVTNRGGRTCHAAIIARELGIPAVVGALGATDSLRDAGDVTVSCAEGETGFIYEGLLPVEVQERSLEALPEIPVDIMMNVGTPDQAFSFSHLPHKGVGLARLEFIINRELGIHPLALLDPDGQDAKTRDAIVHKTAHYPTPRDFYVQTLASGVAMIAAAFYPQPVIVRMSDFKTNEYANLLGGVAFEPHEENPMIGFRGASRYTSEHFRPAFDMECDAIRHVRNDVGLTNVKIMIPFVRTVDEMIAVNELLAGQGLARGENGLEVIMMCEIPSNVVLADQFLEHVDGYSIGSNDLTQLTLGLDRDSGIVAELFDERNDAVTRLMSQAITACVERGKYIGICGQGPSDHPELAIWLADQGISSLSLNPDSVVPVWQQLAQHYGK
ncbi:phosphoenolpyruvate synthase [Pontimonas salivibrio]|uniref:Phosphoenolpyruvate synthase n=1 Tax=Pontimonas salivibrio TaxID=1159327 RepID=A0A2L2BN72_9MICO|nr:phosphoenolpyruvate synthase [Pontimonas salivibrio]AVG23125.1 phosphoenolpyruvate synthase [Pontimonas salivibrio]